MEKGTIIFIQLQEINFFFQTQFMLLLFLIFANELQAMGRGALYFCPLLKISKCNPYLKILDPTKHFIADTPMKINIQKILFTPSQSTLKYGSENCPIAKRVNDRLSNRTIKKWYI